MGSFEDVLRASESRDTRGSDLSKSSASSGSILSSASSGSRSSSVGNRSRVSMSEIAGERLYQNALETQKKIEMKAIERSKVPKPTLTLATRGRRSREPSPLPGQPPRYLQLYESAKVKRQNEMKEAEERETADVRSSTPLRNQSCERLYMLSAQKQQEGKERRIEIMKAKEKPPLPESHYKKISPEKAAKLYERGMKHLISLEMKRMEVAFEMEQEYVSPLVPKSKEKEQFLSRE